MKILEDEACYESFAERATTGSCAPTLRDAVRISCTASDTVDQNDLNAGSVTNIATATADGTTSDTDTRTASATQGAVLTLLKSITSGNPFGAVVDVIRNSFAATNTAHLLLSGSAATLDHHPTDEL